MSLPLDTKQQTDALRPSLFHKDTTWSSGCPDQHPRIHLTPTTTLLYSTVSTINLGRLMCKESRVSLLPISPLVNHTYISHRPPVFDTSMIKATRF